MTVTPHIPETTSLPIPHFEAPGQLRLSRSPTPRRQWAAWPPPRDRNRPRNAARCCHCWWSPWRPPSWRSAAPQWPEKPLHRTRTGPPWSAARCPPVPGPAASCWARRDPHEAGAAPLWTRHSMRQTKCWYIRLRKRLCHGLPGRPSIFHNMNFTANQNYELQRGFSGVFVAPWLFLISPKSHAHILCCCWKILNHKSLAVSRRFSIFGCFLRFLHGWSKKLSKGMMFNTSSPWEANLYQI